MHHEHSIGSEDLKEYGTFSGDLSEQQTVPGELLPQDLPMQELTLQAICQTVSENATPS